VEICGDSNESKYIT